MGIDKSKLKTLEKLKELGFDTRKKIEALDGREMFNQGLTAEMGNIFDLQDAFKKHGELAWLLDGVDPMPVKKEAAKHGMQERNTGAVSANHGY